MFGQRNPFEKTVESIFNNIEQSIFNNIEPTWQQEFRFANPFNDTDLAENSLTIALPGFSKKDIKIDVDGDLLVISSEVEAAQETKFKKSFKRSFRLIKDIDVDTIKATMENGILSITFDKKNVTKEIKIS